MNKENTKKKKNKHDKSVNHAIFLAPKSWLQAFFYLDYHGGGSQLWGGAVKNTQLMMLQTFVFKIHIN